MPSWCSIHLTPVTLDTWIGACALESIGVCEGEGGENKKSSLKQVFNVFLLVYGSLLAS